METKVQQVQGKLREIFEILEVDIEDPSVIDTPKRIAKMWCNEIFNDYNYTDIHKLNEQMTLFDNVEGSKIPITMTMPFTSWCEHHLLPFFGEIRVTYTPSDKIIGLSKIPRIVEYFSQRPQLQERLGKDIAEYLQNITGSDCVRVDIYNTTHTCVACRGIKTNADTKTSYVAKGR